MFFVILPPLQDQKEERVYIKKPHIGFNIALCGFLFTSITWVGQQSFSEWLNFLYIR